MRRALVTPSRNARPAVVLGRLLAVAFLLCIAMGIYSQLLQEPLPRMVFPTRPLWLCFVSASLRCRSSSSGRCSSTSR